MQARELIRLLERHPDAHVVVGGEVIHSATIISGKIVVGYYNPRFEIGKGNDKAVIFKRSTELSDGSVDTCTA